MESFELLAKALRPLPEKWHGLKDVELRYRMRYLDLIANRGERSLCRPQRGNSEYARVLMARGFLEVETPVLSSIPGGANAGRFKPITML